MREQESIISSPAGIREPTRISRNPTSRSRESTRDGIDRRRGRLHRKARQGIGEGVMDLGIAGRRAIVCASSKGLGKGCAMALAREGVHVVVNARSENVLRATAAEIRRESSVEVTPVVADVTTPEGRAALLAACPNPDILVDNAGGPPPRDVRERARAH